MSNASFRPRHRALCILGASALTSLLLATPAFAGDVYLGGLATAQTHQKFIVTYKDGSSALNSPSVLTSSLRTAARALPAKAGKPLGLNSVRRLAVGPELVQADRALDRAEAETLMRQLAADPNVQSVEVDQMLYPTLTPNDSRLSEQWAFGTTNAGLNIRPAWDKSTGANVVVAVIDTGIVSHPDLDANILPGYDFISDATAARDGNGRDNNPADEGDWNSTSGCTTSNSSWHGTHVAGTVAAVTNNTTGVAGTAFNAKVVPVRVLGRCGGSLSDIADAIIWASGGTVSGVPANCANVIAVAATTSAGAKASYSNYGSGIDVSAPGSGILSTLNSGTTTPGNASYASYNGTSMAAPHVAGVVALVQSVAPTTLTPAAVETLLKNTARALPGACSGGCGAGIVDADAAVTAAIAGSSGGGGGGTGNTLTNGTPVTGLGAATGAELNYTITVPAGSGTLTVATSGGSGDADLYVRAGSAPTDTVYACRPYLDGNAETCSITSPSGTYYVRIKAYSTFSGVTLTASY
ncbi:S8 family serine peptidase [Xanthomonas campestris pv. passiflorae]|uniref:S8 family serine peptidase n=1 Tax=Xanthomonas campestris TaxID=339 RepID=UPI002427647E|nr:S8 family serine peptidase [Xanthomonas campestris]MBV6813914.1 S8 family serine peptidase [Xanthomonas campestris pv. passiflorae]